MKHKKFRNGLFVFLIIVLMVAIGGYTWVNQTYAPTEELFSLVSENSYEKVGDFYVFNPQDSEIETGIVLYPGALVEPLSYAYYAQELAKEGYLVAIAEVPLNLSIISNEIGEQFISQHEEIDSWYVAGHSMGGVSATTYAANHLEKIDGVILLGSYPASSTDLSDTNLDVLSLYAEYDGLSTEEKIFSKEGNLPSTTTYVKILGGNHAQFGMYGEQSGDGLATISVIEQQNQIINQTVQFLNQSKEKR